MMLRCHAIYKWMSPFPLPKQEMGNVGKGTLGRKWEGRRNYGDTIHPPATLTLSRQFRGCLRIFSPTPPHRLQHLPETPCHHRESLPLPRDKTFLIPTIHMYHFHLWNKGPKQGRVFKKERERERSRKGEREITLKR